MDIEKLRNELQRIIKYNLDDQPRMISELSQPHEIELKCRMEHHDDIRKFKTDYHFNCYMYCFGITHGDIKDENGNILDRIPKDSYVSYLIKNALNEIFDEKNVNNGDFVVYFEGETPKHAGIYDGGKIISKWGDHSHVWKHKFFELPIYYGDRIKCYTKISRERCLKAYSQWLAEYKIE